MSPTIPKLYFSETTLRHLKPRQGLSERHRRRALDVTLASSRLLACMGLLFFIFLCILFNYPFDKNSRNSAGVIIRVDAG